MIRVDHLTKRYREGGMGRAALDDVTLEVRRGEFLAVMGHSGSGKTTLLNVLGGLDRDCTGHVVVDGREVSRMTDRELSRMRNGTMGFVFQAFHLLPQLTVIENVCLPASFAEAGGGTDAMRRALDALERVGLAQKAPVRPTQLSAGEKQRVAIARAIFNRPPLLLCDEPTGNLDAATGGTVLDIFHELNEHDGTTLVIATHEARVGSAASRRIDLEAGRIVADTGKGTTGADTGMHPDREVRP